MRLHTNHWRFVASILLASQAQASPYSDSAKIDIAAGVAQKTLQEFAKQTGLQLAFESDAVRGRPTQAVRGTVRVEDALAEMLTRSGLVYRIVNEKTVAIVPENAGQHARGSTSAYTQDMTLNNDASTDQRSSRAFAEAGSQGAGTSGLETQDGQEDKLHEVVITGSHIRNSEPISPVITMSRQDLVNQGYTRLDQALEQLPQNSKGGVAADSNPVNAVGFGATNNYSFSSGVNLRGLGPGATLVLLNGERLPPTALGSSVDLSSIPVSIIDRVEILTDGASAVYGSDAIGGVVNIMTRRDFEGVEFGGRLASISNGKDPNYGGNVLGGLSWNGGNFVANFDHEQDHPLLASKREFSANAPVPSDLLPRQDISTIYATLTQSVMPALEATGDLLFSDRTYRNEQNFDLYNLGLLTNDGRAKQLDTSFNLQYSLSKWTIAATGQYGRESDTLNTNYSGPPESGNSSSFVYTVPSLDLRADGEIVRTPGGSLKAALGAQWRKETFRTDYFNSFGLPEVADSRTVSSAYAEILLPVVGRENSVPLIQDLRINVAVRYDHYSDFGSTTNPKFALGWRPIDDLTLRASYARSFKAPQFYESVGARYGYVYAEPDPKSAAGTTTVLWLDGPNSSLQPERANTFESGFTYKPAWLPDFKLDVDYFRIDYKQRIIHLFTENFGSNLANDEAALGPLVTVNPSATQVTAALASVPPDNLVSLVDSYSPSDIQAVLNLGFNNAAVSRVAGSDVALSYEHRSGPAILRTSLIGAYLSKYTQQVTATSNNVSILNTLYNPLRFRASANMGGEVGDLGANVRVNFTGSYRNIGDPTCTELDGCHVSSWTTLDTSLYYNVKRDSSSPLRGLRIAIDVINLADRSPPQINSHNPFVFYDAVNANPLGRALALTFSKAF